MQFNYLCSGGNHVSGRKGPRHEVWSALSLSLSLSLSFTDSLMAKQPAGHSQDVGCLCSVVQSQEKNHSFPPVEMLQMFSKLQGSGWRDQAGHCIGP